MQATVGLRRPLHNLADPNLLLVDRVHGSFCMPSMIEMFPLLRLSWTETVSDWVDSIVALH